MKYKSSLSKYESDGFMFPSCAHIFHELCHLTLNWIYMGHPRRMELLGDRCVQVITPTDLFTSFRWSCDYGTSNKSNEIGRREGPVYLWGESPAG